MEEYLLLGYITDSFSLDGSLKVLSKTDFASFRYEKGKSVYLFNEKTQERKEYKVISYRPSGIFDLVKLEGINTKEEVLSFKGYEVQVIKNNNELKKGYYFFSDLKGCTVIDQNKNELGVVKVIEEYPAQITLRVKKPDGKEFLVPFVKAFISKVDIENKIINIKTIEGML